MNRFIDTPKTTTAIKEQRKYILQFYVKGNQHLFFHGRKTYN